MLTTECEFRRRYVYAWILELITGLMLLVVGFYYARHVWLQISTHGPITIGKYSHTIVRLEERPYMYVASGVFSCMCGLGLIATGIFKVIRQIVVNPWSE
jgi:hypothetical protein